VSRSKAALASLIAWRSTDAASGPSRPWGAELTIAFWTFQAINHFHELFLGRIDPFNVGKPDLCRL
jgi:hypothetical protein